MTVVIRPRAEEDIPSLADVLVRVHEQDGYPVEGVAEPEKWLLADHTLGAWVAEAGAQAVGQVLLTKPGKGDEAANVLARQEGIALDRIAVLGRLFVDPPARGQRISRKLITTAVEYSRALNCCPVLDVMEKDEAAIATYRSMGWEELAHFQHAWPGGQVPALAFRFPLHLRLA